MHAAALQIELPVREAGISFSVTHLTHGHGCGSSGRNLAAGSLRNADLVIEAGWIVLRIGVVRRRLVRYRERDGIWSGHYGNHTGVIASNSSVVRLGRPAAAHWCAVHVYRVQVIGCNLESRCSWGASNIEGAGEGNGLCLGRVGYELCVPYPLGTIAIELVAPSVVLKGFHCWNGANERIYVIAD